MHVAEQSEDRLVLRDNQLDKKIGIGIMVLALLGTAFFLAAEGAWLFALIPAALAAAALLYLKLTLLSSVVTFDRAADRVTLSVTSRNSSEDWHWALSDLAGAEVSERGRSGTSESSRKQPVIVLKDGTHIPIRPYHSAGAQSWTAIIAIRRFIGQDKMDDLPVGWIHDD